MGRAKPLDVASCVAVVSSPRWSRKVHEDPSGCLLWLGATTSDGYGLVWLSGRSVYAHRVALVAKLGRDIGGGMDAAHLCHDESVRVGDCVGGACSHRLCVCSDHLAEQSYQQNTRLGLSSQAANALKTHCPQGHELAGDNLVISQFPRRSCLTCARANSRRYSDTFSQAVRILGITHREYRELYGYSVRVAEEIVASHA